MVTSRINNAPVMQATPSDPHRERIDSSYRDHAAAMKVAGRLGRTEAEMIGLVLAARCAPVSEEQFRDTRRDSINWRLDTLHNSFSALCGAYASQLSTDDEAKLAIAFDMIRSVASGAAVVRDPLAARELAIIRHAIDGPGDRPLQSLLSSTSKPAAGDLD